ncbi:unnamed protein product [Sphagnum jensenii]|uniref:U-box domain-containing protein n=1 Tax=Sphagnum jensenii TaxID=128206 RepID=A0ABP0VAF9_9BRYO
MESKVANLWTSSTDLIPTIRNSISITNFKIDSTQQSTIDCGVDDLREENAELRREKRILQSLLNGLSEHSPLDHGYDDKLQITSNSINSHEREDFRESCVTQVRVDLEHTKRSIAEYERRLKDALLCLQEARIESLQVLPLRLKLHELKNKQDRLNTQLYTLNESYEALLVEKAHLTQEVDRLQSEVQAAVSQNELLLDSLRHRDEELADMRKKVEGHESALSTLSGDITRLTVHNNALESRHSQMYTEKNHLEKLCASLAKECQRVKNMKAQQPQVNAKDINTQEIYTDVHITDISQPATLYDPHQYESEPADCFMTLTICIWGGRRVTSTSSVDERTAAGTPNNNIDLNNSREDSLLDNPETQQYLFDQFTGPGLASDAYVEYTNPLFGRTFPTFQSLRQRNDNYEQFEFYMPQMSPSPPSAGIQRNARYNSLNEAWATASPLVRQVSYTLPAPRPRPGSTTQPRGANIVIRTQIEIQDNELPTHDAIMRLNDLEIPSYFDSSQTPSYFKCPISLDLMSNPVQCSDGQTYNRKEIVEWLNRSNISPITKQPIKLLFPNYNLRAAIEDYIKSNTTEPQMDIKFLNYEVTV